MTDISKLADAIVDLINRNMRSPRKDEIEAVLLEHIPPTTTSGWVAPADCGSVFSLLGTPVHKDDTLAAYVFSSVESWNADPLTGCYQLTQEDLEAAADAICAAEEADRVPIFTDAKGRPIGNQTMLNPIKYPRDHWEKGAVGLDHPAKSCDRDGHQFSVRDVCDRCGTTLLEMLGQQPKI